MALATLSVDLVAKTASFESDLGKAARASEAASARMAAAFDAVKAAVLPLAAGFSVAGLTTMFNDATRAVDGFNDLKDATGASIENISALDRIARETGGTFETAASSLVKFNGVLNKTDEDGNAASQVFKALGLDAAELKKIDPAEALLKTAVAFNSFADDGNKARAAQILFGKSLQEVAPFLKDLAEKGELVASTTTAQAEEAEKYNKQLTRMKANHEDLVRNIANSVLPALNDLLEKLQAAGGFSGAIKIRLGLDDQSQTEGQLFALRKAADFTFASIERISAELSKSPNDAAVAKRLDDARAKYAALSKQIGEASNKLKGFANAASPLPVAGAVADADRPALNVPKVPKDPGKDPAETLAARQAKAYNELINKIKEKIAVDELENASGIKVTDAQKQQLEIIKLVADGKIKASDANSKATKALLEEMAASEAANEQSKLRIAFDQQLRDAAYATATARGKEVAALVESNQKFAEEIDLIGQTEEVQRAIIRARESSTIAVKEDQLARLDLIGACTIESEALRTEIELLRERQGLGDIKSALIISDADTKKAAEYSADLKKDLAGAFGDALKDTKNPIEAFGRSLATTVSSRMSAALAESLADAALKAVNLGSGGSGSGGGIVGSLVNAVAGFFSGGTSTTATSQYSLSTASNYSGGGLGLKFNARGGVYDSPSLSAYRNQIHSTPKVFAFAKGAGVFGEAGPEAIMPLTRAANGSLGVRAMGGQGGTVVNVVVENHGTDTAATSSTEQQSDGSSLVRIILRAVADDTSSGGITARATAQRFALKTV